MKKGGLQLEKDGSVTLGGVPYRAFGVNCFNLASQCIGKEDSDPTLAIKTLQTLKENGVKVIRFSTGGFYPSGWKDFMDHPEKWYKIYDAVFETASKLEIGLITSFFWTKMFCDVFDEGCAVAFANPWNNPSKSLAFMKDFTQTFVKRYAESPAAFMWEYGNEHNLDVDIPWIGLGRPLPEGSKRTRRTQWEDMETTKGHGELLQWWASVVKEADPYKRITGTGDAVTRPCAYNLAFHNQDMTPDKCKEDHLKAMALLNPDGIDAMSIHEYSTFTFIKKEYGLDIHGKPGLLGEDIGTNNWDERMQLFRWYAKQLGKTTYLGEFGVGTGDPYDIAEYDMHFRAIFDAVVKNDIAMALYWNYDYNTEQIPGDLTDHGTGVEYSCNERWEKGRHILGLIKEYNEKLDN